MFHRNSKSTWNTNQWRAKFGSWMLPCAMLLRHALLWHQAFQWDSEIRENHGDSWCICILGRQGRGCSSAGSWLWDLPAIEAELFWTWCVSIFWAVWEFIRQLFKRGAEKNKTMPTTPRNHQLVLPTLWCRTAAYLSNHFCANHDIPTPKMIQTWRMPQLPHS